MKFNDELLKKAASSYAESEGERLLEECKDLEGFDFKVPIRRKNIRKLFIAIPAFAVPVAACLAVILLYLIPLSNIPAEVMEETGENEIETRKTIGKTVGIEDLSSMLPEGYSLTKIDYDHQKTIYHINGNIMLAAEYSEDTVNHDSFTHMSINGNDAYILSRKDYSVLYINKEGLSYTITSPYDTADLINIAQSVIF